MQIIIKPCSGMTEPEAMSYALSIFTGTKVDWRSYKEGIYNGCVLTYNDSTIAYLYKTKTAYVVRFDYYSGEGKKGL